MNKYNDLTMNVIAYLLVGLVVAIVLSALDKLPILSSPAIAVKESW